MTMEDPQVGGIVIPFPNARSRSATGPAQASQAGASPGVPTSRGVETLFRSVYASHLTLDAMADNKARMMIQIDGLILSVLIAANPVLGSVLGPVDVGTAAIALVVACSASMLFAVLAARPRGDRRRWARSAASSRPGLLLDFSECSALGHDAYVERMNALVQEPASLYESMSSHLYTLGRRLDRKYTWLRLSYGALAMGIVAACLVQLAG